jgi:hypothetical protein
MLNGVEQDLGDRKTADLNTIHPPPQSRAPAPVKGWRPLPASA